MRKIIVIALLVTLAGNCLQAQITRITSYRSDSDSTGLDGGIAGWKPVDSIHYVYSGNRGGVSNQQNTALGFDEGDQYAFQNPGWLFNVKYIETFDGNNRLLSNTQQNYSNGNWVNYSRSIYSYNTRGQYISNNEQAFDTTGNQWITTYYDSSFYNTQNQLAVEITFDPRPYPDDEYGTIDSFIYNAAGEVSNHYNTQWNNGWTPEYEDIYTYNTDSQVVTDVNLLWNGSSVINSILDSSDYDIYGNLIQQIVFVWQENAWSLSGRDTFGYDSNNNQLLEIIQSSSNPWENWNRYDRTFNGDNKILTEIFSDWSGSWFPEMKNIYTYDDNNNQTCYALYYYGTDTSLIPGYRYLDWYTEISGIPTITNTIVSKVFPNPSTGSFDVEFTSEQGGDAQFLLYDLTGKLITTTITTTTPGINRLSWDAYDLPKGCYLYHLQIPDGTGNGKLVIE